MILKLLAAMLFVLVASLAWLDAAPPLVGSWHLGGPGARHTADIYWRVP